MERSVCITIISNKHSCYEVRIFLFQFFSHKAGPVWNVLDIDHVIP